MRRTTIAIAMLAALAGCGGGGNGSLPAGGNGGSPSGHGTANAQFTIVIPGTGSGTQSRGVQSVRPNYVSENTRSLTVAINGGTPFEYDLTATSNGCSQPGGSGTAVSCSETIAAPIGTDESWVFKTYPSTGGAGNVLAQATVSDITINSGEANDLGDFTLNGVVGSYALSWASTPSFTAGSSGTATVDLVVKDPSGAVIIAPGSYVDAAGNADTFSLSDDIASNGAPWSDTSLSYSLGTTSIGSPSGSTSPSNTSTVSYGGISMPSSTITATDSDSVQTNATLSVAAVLGTPSATATCNSGSDSCSTSTGTISSTNNGTISFVYAGDTASIVSSETGWTTSPYDQGFSMATTCASPVATVSAGAANHWTVTSGSSSGSCTITLTDSTVLTSAGQTQLQFQVYNTITNIGIQSKRSAK